ncbi:glycosyltransferase [Helicobacter sp.]|uniref:glycosyltransferase family 2 protein n=1 Tax=Helicobacter sp. TaxID=218 RepID=UPI0034215BA7|nr:glycosyltransferase [Helicobacter sp.]
MGNATGSCLDHYPQLQPRYIAAALDSILAQSYVHWEALVVDDGSSDRSPAIIEGYASKDSRITPIFLHTIKA